MDIVFDIYCRLPPHVEYLINNKTDTVMKHVFSQKTGKGRAMYLRSRMSTNSGGSLAFCTVISRTTT